MYRNKNAVIRKLNKNELPSQAQKAEIEKSQQLQQKYENAEDSQEIESHDEEEKALEPLHNISRVTRKFQDISSNNINYVCQGKISNKDSISKSTNSASKKRKLNKKIKNPRPPKKRRLLIKHDHDLTKEKQQRFSFENLKRPKKRKKNLGMKQQLVTLNHKFFAETLKKATENDTNLTKNILKILKIPETVLKAKDHKLLTQFPDLFMNQNFDSPTWTETIENSKNKEGMKIIYLNANGKVWQKLKLGHMFRTEFVDKQQAEIIILSETLSQKVSKINLQGYHQHTITAKHLKNDSKIGRASGGVTIFVKNEVRNMIEIIYRSQNSDVFGIKVENEKHQDILITGYCPPAENSQQENLLRVASFYESVYEALEKAKKEGSKNIHNSRL